MKTPFAARPLSARIRRTLLCSALLGPVFIALPASAEQAVTRDYQIAQGDLGMALTRFAAEAGIVLSFDPGLTRGLSTPGLQGHFDVTGGLSRLLQGSGLQPTTEGDDRYSLTPSSTRSDALQLESTSIVSNSFGTITEQSRSYTPGTVATATRMTLTPRQTPQSISVVTRQHMDDFALTSINDVMNHTPGVSSVAQDSERTEYMVRGFGVNNFQYDGIPSTRVSTYSAGHTLSDMAIYDRVEILKGSTGLLTGTGTPGASINLIRKKPTAEFQGHITTSAGSWDNYRSELDVAGALTESGNVRGRAVAAYQDRHAYLDRLQKQITTYYGVLDFDLTPDTLLTLGADYQDSIPEGSSWGGGIAYDSNGQFNKVSRSFNNGTDWTAWEQYTRSVFSTLEHGFSSGWLAKLHLNHQVNGYDASLAGIGSGNPDPQTGLGTRLWVGKYVGKTTSNSADLYLSGPFELFDREHELIIGGTISRKRWEAKNYARQSTYSTAVPDYYNWSGNAPEPDWQFSRAYDETTRERGIYSTGRLTLTDDLKLILGGRVSDYRGETVSKVGVFTPYAGLVYDLNQHLSLYGSYTSIFSPQTLKNEQGKALDPLEGDSYEAGVKGEFFEGRFSASLAYFEIEQDNYAVATGNRAPDGTNAYRAEQGVIVKGYEAELSGELAPGWQAQAGYTHKVARRDSAKVSTISPENQFKLYSSYRLPGELSAITLGAGARWQSVTWADLPNPAGGTSRFEQNGFWLVDLMGRYKISDGISLSLNLNNALDKKYYTILDYYSIYIWGEPRNLTANLRWDF